MNRLQKRAKCRNSATSNRLGCANLLVNIKLDNDSLFSLKGTYLQNKTEKQIHKLWIEFSEIQCASYIQVDKSSIQRFFNWIFTGDDNNAWS